MRYRRLAKTGIEVSEIACDEGRSERLVGQVVRELPETVHEKLRAHRWVRNLYV